MEIKSVEISGLKNVTAETVKEYDLSGLDLFVGPNGSGKTTVLQAVELAMTGRVGAIGGTLSKTMGMVNTTAAKGYAELVTEEHAIRQVLTRKGQRNSEDVLIDGEPTVSLAESQSLRAKFFGVNPIMFDLGKFIGLSDAKRRDWLSEHIASMSVEGELVTAIMLAAFREMLGDSTVDTAIGLVCGAAKPTDVQRTLIVEKLWQMHEPIGESLETMIATLSIATGAGDPSKLQAAWEQCHRAFLDTRAARRKSEEALEGAAAGTEYVSPEQLAELAEQEKTLQVEIETLVGDINRAHEARTQLEKREKEIEMLDLRLADANKDIAKLNAVLKVPEGAEYDPSDRLVEISSERSKIEREIHGLEGIIEQLAEATKFIRSSSDPLSAGMCAACNRPFKNPEEAHVAIADAKAKAVAHASKVAELADPLALLIDEFSEITASEKLWEKLHQLQSRLLGERRKWVEFNPDVPDTTIMQAELDARRESRAAVVVKREEMSKAQGAAELRAELELAVANQKRLEEWSKHLDDGLRQMLHKPVAAAIDTLLTDLKLLLEKTGYMPAVTMTEKELTLGIYFDGVYVPFEQLSNGQKAVFGAALITALINYLDSPVKVLLIEAGEVDIESISTFLAALKLWGGPGPDKIVDNILVTTHMPFVPDCDTEDWKVHYMR